MAPKYRLTYYDCRARAEIARLLFAAAQVPFEDVRIEQADWPQLKPTIPLGTVPMLEVNGKKFCQSLAISSFLAREFGLYGSSNMECFIIDQIQQQREDLFTATAKTMFAKDEESKAANQKSLNEVSIPTTLKFFNETIKSNAGGGGYAVGKKLTMADLIIHEGTQNLFQENPSLLDNYPEIKALRTKVESGEALKNYFSTRKVTVI